MIGVGDKVVCLIDFSQQENHIDPVPKKGQVFVVRKLGIEPGGPNKGSLGLWLVGIRGRIHPDYNEEHGFLAARFRKLEDYRNEQELEYRRTQPAQEPQHA